MKKKGTMIAALFLLTGLLAASLAQLQSCAFGKGAQTGQSTLRPLDSVPMTSHPQTGKTDPSTPPATTPSKPKTEPEPTTTKIVEPTQPTQPTTARTTQSTPPATPPYVGPTVPEELDFVLDLSEYERYMNPTGDDWSDDYLILLNADHPVTKDYEKTLPYLKNIVSMTSVSAYDHEDYRTGQKFNETALQALTAMFLEAKAEGISNLYSTSAYRDYAYQTSVFNRNVGKTNGYHCESCGEDWIGKSDTCPACGVKSTTLRDVTKAEKEANVATYSCRPGTSDHQSGLAVDIIQSSLPSRYWGLIQEFGETKAGVWLAENSWKFGFVLRFPADKEDVTGIIYEPWHFRFVGREHAIRMKEMNLCLEEYVEYLEKTGYFDR